MFQNRVENDLSSLRLLQAIESGKSCETLLLTSVIISELEYSAKHTDTEGLWQVLMRMQQPLHAVSTS